MNRIVPILLGIATCSAGVYMQTSTKTGDFGLALIVVGALWVIVNLLLRRVSR